MEMSILSLSLLKICIYDLYSFKYIYICPLLLSTVRNDRESDSERMQGNSC